MGAVRFVHRGRRRHPELPERRLAHRTREAALARDQERARHARILHDRALQALETLAKGAWVPDPQVRAHVAAEAAWLRSLIEHGPPTADGDLLAGLRQLVADKARDGLRVEFNNTGLRPAELPAGTVTALVDAVRELLINVSNHADTDTAVLRAATGPDGTLRLSVLDHGRGFDLTTTYLGTGLTESVRGRATDIGAAVRLDSAPGAGTYVEITTGPPEAADRSPEPPRGNASRMSGS
ncbi:sensor histidine kinase [Streptomyces sp. NPDC059629]|uniref:sensor histidine kinase n=1 Tax=Streptomyces sp. NPDC059629 TaxID=3346889 RepID=UPI0036860797